MPSFSYTYKSPLRYPGGKQRDIRFLANYIPACNEFREPFLGGGSVLLHQLKLNHARTYWGNDLNSKVLAFWQQTKCDAKRLANLVENLKENYHGPKKNSPEWQVFRQVFTQRLNNLPPDQLHQAARFFILNRSTSGGATESGGLTAGAYCDRFTASSIETLRKLHNVLTPVQFTNKNYAELLTAPGKDVFIFLDPPYLSAERSGLYGKSGDLHKGFDHQRLANDLQQCEHQWLMTIDDSPEIHELYSWVEGKRAWQKAYGMTNAGGRKSKRGSELLLANFSLETTAQPQQTSLLEKLKIPE